MRVKYLGSYSTGSLHIKTGVSLSFRYSFHCLVVPRPDHADTTNTNHERIHASLLKNVQVHLTLPKSVKKCRKFYSRRNMICVKILYMKDFLVLFIQRPRTNIIGSGTN